MDVRLINAQAVLENVEAILREYAEANGGREVETKDAHLSSLRRVLKKDFETATANSTPQNLKRLYATAIILEYYVNENY